MLTELFEKYGNQKPMDLGSHVEKTIPVSAVIKMIEEYHEAKRKELLLNFIEFVNNQLAPSDYFAIEWIDDYLNNR